MLAVISVYGRVSVGGVEGRVSVDSVEGRVGSVEGQVSGR